MVIETLNIKTSLGNAIVRLFNDYIVTVEVEGNATLRGSLYIKTDIQAILNPDKTKVMDYSIRSRLICRKGSAFGEVATDKQIEKAKIMILAEILPQLNVQQMTKIAILSLKQSVRSSIEGKERLKKEYENKLRECDNEVKELSDRLLQEFGVTFDSSEKVED